MESKDVFEIAKKAELDGKALYEEELTKTEDPGIQEILKMLIETEEKHYKYFDALSKNKEKELLINVSIAKIKKIFQETKDKGKQIITSADHSEFYKKALEFEEWFEKFYRSSAENTADEEIKAALILIAQEEHRHVVLIKGLLDMVMNPKQWVEDAEFNHLEEY